MTNLPGLSALGQNLPAYNLPASAPILVMTATGLILLLVDAFSRPGPYRSRELLLVGLTGIFLAAVFLVRQWGGTGDLTFFRGLGVTDSLAVFLGLIILGSAAMTLLISTDYLGKWGSGKPECPGLVVLAASGMLVMVSTTNILVIFLGLEVMSLSCYVLAGALRERARSAEAAMKYFLMGAFASGLLFLGIAFLYGVSGRLELTAFRSWVEALPEAEAQGVRGLLLLGTGLVLVGFAFKVAAVPFHMWAPDVYEGAPTPVTAFMVTAVKAAAVGTFLRVCAVGLPPLVAEVGPVLWGLAALTMLVGNLVALTQTNAKRMLAYSSIAHAGTMLVGLYVLREDASAAVLYYLVAYSFASVGAFAVMSFFETKEGRGLTFDEYAGLASRYPLVCAAMAVFMLSLIGVPLTAGFMGKFYIFRSAIRAGAYWLAGIGILSSLVSLYYYLRMVGRMYMGTPLVTAASDPVERTSPRLTVALALALAGTLWYGFGPQVGLGVEDLWMAARQAQRVVQAEGAAGAQTSLPTSGPGVRPSSASGAAPSR